MCCARKKISSYLLCRVSVKWGTSFRTNSAEAFVRSGCSILLPTASARVLPWQQAVRQWCFTTGLLNTFQKAFADQSQNGCAPCHRITPEICKATRVWFGKRCLRVRLRYHKRVCEQLWLEKNLNNDSNASLRRSGDYDTLREVMNSSCAQKFQSVTQEPFRRKERTSPRQETQLMITRGWSKGFRSSTEKSLWTSSEAAGGPFFK